MLFVFNSWADLSTRRAKMGENLGEEIKNTAAEGKINYNIVLKHMWKSPFLWVFNGCKVFWTLRDQKVAGSNPVTSTKNLSEDYNLQTFLLFGFARFFLQNPLFPEQIRIPADMPLFGFNRMTTDKGGCVELRVWFWGSVSVRGVHWQKRVEKGGRDEKKVRPEGFLSLGYGFFCIVFVLDLLCKDLHYVN